MIKFMSALLFACSLAVLGFFGFWALLLDKMQQELPLRLGKGFAGQVTIGSIEPIYDPGMIRLRLKNVEYRSEPTLQGFALGFSLPELEFQTDYFSKHQIGLVFPEVGTLYSQQPGAPETAYEMHLTNGKLQLFLQDEEFHFRFDRGRLLENGVVQVEIGQATTMTKHLDDLQRHIRIAARDVNIQAFRYRIAEESVLFDGIVNRFPTPQEIWLPLIATDVTQDLPAYGRAMIQNVVAANGGVQLTNLTLRNPQRLLSLRGILTIDAQQNLAGDVSMVVPRRELLERALLQTRIVSQISDRTLTELQIQMGQPPFTYNLAFRNGEMLINSRNFGKTRPLLALIP